MHDLHDARLLQALHPLSDGGLGQPDCLADRGVGLPAIGLELLDDPLGDIVKNDRCGRTAARTMGHAVPSCRRISHAVTSDGHVN